MIYRVNLASQGGKPFAFHERPNRSEAEALAAKLAKRYKGLTITISKLYL